MVAKPKPERKAKEKPRKTKTSRQKLILQLSDLCRQITIYRDACTCVLSKVDGVRCNDVSQWGHVIPQGESGFLKHSLSNSFRQCGSHNTIHKYNQIIYLEWYRETFGNTAIKMLKDASQVTYHKFTIQDLIDRREEYKRMLEDLKRRIGFETMESMIVKGYYGEVIQKAWIKDGKI